MRVAAAYADAWHTWATPAETARKNAVLDAHCAEVGRDPDSVRRVGGCWVEGLGPTGVGAHVASYVGTGTQELVLHDHRDRRPEETLAILREAAP
jgi:hypothetical protein